MGPDVAGPEAAGDDLDGLMESDDPLFKGMGREQREAARAVLQMSEKELSAMEPEQRATFDQFRQMARENREMRAWRRKNPQAAAEADAAKNATPDEAAAREARIKREKAEAEHAKARERELKFLEETHKAMAKMKAWGCVQGAQGASGGGGGGDRGGDRGGGGGGGGGGRGGG